jgi:insertion element IS1 protein InsB
VCGSRGTETANRLIEKIGDKDIGLFYTDYWKAYEEMLTPYWHVQSKAETYTVEGYNSILRHFLARLKRKTKCYSKSVTMLLLSIKLLMLKRNNQLDILL